MEILRQLARRALDEDLGERGDVTSATTVPADARLRAEVVARGAGVVAGLDWLPAVFAEVDAAVRVTLIARDGDRVDPGAVLARVEGPARAVLAGERTALNLLSHLSGIATLTARYVAEVEGTGAVIRDTRKTIPGLREVAKAAVVAGGGVNHRRGLDDGLLVKDNHVAAAGSVGAATRAALGNPDHLPVQVEVDTLDQLDEALTAGARAVLLDNFDLNDLHAAVARCRREDEAVFVEASGGVSFDSVWAIASAGVDAVAVGALTHSVPSFDVGLDAADPEVA